VEHLKGALPSWLWPIRLGWKGPSGANTLTYLVKSYIEKKLKFCNTDLIIAKIANVNKWKSSFPGLVLPVIFPKKEIYSFQMIPPDGSMF
jgi:hypothetical protein